MKESALPRDDRSDEHYTTKRISAFYTDGRITPGEAVRAALKEKGWLQADLAQILRVTPATISDICQDRRGISYRMAHKLAAAFSNNAMYWASVQSAYDLARARPPKPGIRERRDALIARKSRSLNTRGKANPGDAL